MAITVSAANANANGQEPQDKIIISGASGKLGGLAVEELLKRGIEPGNLILVSRTPEKLEKYARLGASVRYGDFSKPESLPAAYAGGTRMLLISISSGGEKRPEWQEHAIDAARRAGVNRLPTLRSSIWITIPRPLPMTTVLRKSI